jgi:hypothetical protein
MMDHPEPQDVSAAEAAPGAVGRRGLLAAGGAALAGAAAAALIKSDRADAAHDTDIPYSSQTAMHVDVTNTGSGSTRIHSNISGTAAFVALNNYPVGISRPDGILGRTTYTTSNCAGVAGACEAASGGIGVIGTVNNQVGTGVFGFCGSSVPFEVPPTGTGVYGQGPVRGVAGRCDKGVGVQGQATEGKGVTGTADTGVGVQGASTSGIGVRGAAGAAGFAGAFDGRVLVTGRLDTQGTAHLAALALKTSGIATVRKGRASVTISNVPVGAESLVLATLQSRVSGLDIRAAVPSRSRKRITIYLNKKAPRSARVAWALVN